jgi:hypothetical protein
MIRFVPLPRAVRRVFSSFVLGAIFALGFPDQGKSTLGSRDKFIEEVV